MTIFEFGVRIAIDPVMNPSTKTKGIREFQVHVSTVANGMRSRDSRRYPGRSLQVEGRTCPSETCVAESRRMV